MRNCQLNYVQHVWVIEVLTEIVQYNFHCCYVDHHLGGTISLTRL
jgi:hypothetical protein